ncbi:transporter substrate-binding domain-containing protein [Ornithinibacillus halophilus]|uniref:Polar amino acid transport system substrate-binding protein n=1 Tax=Ornithinibacillus halophilus TaxID=930117 RepID=A0A1M5GYV7_9BACI|nr:transporter substrate-binding domain-containing protein [Ornithinibacillus halophilus]SHG08919.1 polar amino acid transport system substrate-binding protein [Ornithinibacillus halophilus]
MKKGLIQVLLIGFLLSLLVACGSESNNGTAANNESDQNDEKEVLIMATSADFPPFESYDTDGNFEGFDIEIAKVIAEELGYELEIEDMSFDGLIGALQSGRVDFVMAGMSATEERRQNVDFSKEYHRSGEMFIYQPDESINGLEELEGKTVGVQLGTIQEEGADVLSEEYGFEVKKVDDASVLIQELMSNRIDVAYMDKTVATGYINSQGLEGFDDPTTSSPGMGIAFPKGSELVEQVNEILTALEKDGTIDELEEEWLSEYE